MEDLTEIPGEATASNSAKLFDKFTTTCDPIFTEKAFFMMSGSGFLPGTSSYSKEFQQNNFISDKYGADYSIKLYNFNETQEGNSDANGEIPIDDPINWFYDYQTGILHIANPEAFSYSTPYKISAYQYVGKVLSDDKSIPSNLISGSVSGSGAEGLWTGSDTYISRESDVQITGSLILTENLSVLGTGSFGLVDCGTF